MTRGRKKETRSLEDRFWDKIYVQDDISGCWNWIGGKSGTNLIFSGRVDGKLQYFMAKRFAWDLCDGEKIPDGRELWNVCGNRKCVNPSHQMINTLENRFWNRVIKKSTSEQCWNWFGHKDTGGYGIISDGKRRCMKVHRVSWEIHIGEIPKGLHVLHKCDNVVCVNPKHLFLGTHQDNMRDAKEKGRIKRGEESGKAKLTMNDVKEIRKCAGRGCSYLEIAKIFNVSSSTVGGIVRKERWAWLD